MFSSDGDRNHDLAPVTLRALGARPIAKVGSRTLADHRISRFANCVGASVLERARKPAISQCAVAATGQAEWRNALTMLEQVAGARHAAVAQNIARNGGSAIDARTARP